MNSLSEIVERGSPELSALPLSVLAWLEIQALKIEYAQLVRQSAAQDAWYLSSDGETSGPEKFAQILQRLIRGQAGLAILHESAVHEESPPWRFISSFYLVLCLCLQT